MWENCHDYDEETERKISKSTRNVSTGGTVGDNIFMNGAQYEEELERLETENRILREGLNKIAQSEFCSKCNAGIRKMPLGLEQHSCAIIIARETLERKNG